MRIVKSLLPATFTATLFALLSALLLVSLFSTPSYAATPDRITGALTSGQTVALKGNVHHRALPQFDRGAVDPAMPLGTITLMTSPTLAQTKALTQLLAQLQDRKSPNYHKWLTPEQFADRFGLSQNDMQQMAAWLKAQGFSMVHQARGRNWISFTGTAAQVQSAFRTEIHHYNVNGELHYANSTAPVIPAALHGIVSGLMGLHDFLPRPMGVHRARPNYYSSSLQSEFVAPGDIATIYDINTLYTAGIDGTGQKLAVMGQTDIYLSDITDFRTGFGLSAISCTTNSSGVVTSCNDSHFKYVLDGGDPGVKSATGDLSEADLDLEWSGAVARGAQIVYVNSTSTFASFYYAIDNTVAPVISLSYGFCEFDANIGEVFPGLPTLFETELMKANTEGITFVNSSGDSGAAECDDSSTVTGNQLATQGLGVSYPASSPEVTSVGGTAVQLGLIVPPSATYWNLPTTNPADGGTAKSYVPEVGWNDDDEIAQFCAEFGGSFCTSNGITSALTSQEVIGISSSGGGPSNCAVQTADFSSCVSGFPKPSWQTVTISGQTTRLSPDVSFLATPNFPGYIFCTELSELGDSGTGSSCLSGGSAGITNALNLNNPSLIGGTSVSAPVFAGVVTLLNQYLEVSGGLGNVNPMLYSLAADPSNGAFNPVTTGENTVYCVAGEPSFQPPALQCPGTGVLGFQASNLDATTGYNLVAGLGSVDVSKLALAWAATLSGFSASSSSLSPASISAGNSTTSTVTITPQNGFSGTVTFSCSGLPTGATCTFNPTSVSGGSGTTQLTIQTSPNMAAATTTVTVNGTSGAVSSSTTVSLTVTATTESFSLTSSLGTGAALSVAQGGTSGPVTLTVTSSTGFIITSGTSSSTALPLTYTCANLPSESSCLFSPNSTSSATSVSFTIKTTAPTVAQHRPDRSLRIFYAALLPGLFGIMFTFGSRKRSLHGMRLLGLIVVLGFSTLWLASCGGSSGSSNKDPGTPKGTSTVTVNATTGGSAPITGSPVLSFQFTVN